MVHHLMARHLMVRHLRVLDMVCGARYLGSEFHAAAPAPTVQERRAWLPFALAVHPY